MYRLPNDSLRKSSGDRKHHRSLPRVGPDVPASTPTGPRRVVFTFRLLGMRRNTRRRRRARNVRRIGRAHQSHRTRALCRHEYAGHQPSRRIVSHRGRGGARFSGRPGMSGGSISLGAGYHDETGGVARFDGRLGKPVFQRTAHAEILDHAGDIEIWKRAKFLLARISDFILVTAQSRRRASISRALSKATQWSGIRARDLDHGRR